ncbi:MAG TPA: MBL fold metallo-hydrolase, partial [Gemmatimonadales bacterium]|nr:MBL fold metallo-hydrolase [Gemmatimonadales bacterium]
RSDGWTLRGDLRLPGGRGRGPLAILLHKAAGDRTIFRDLAARLADAGIGSLRVDLRGHGESVNRGRFVPGHTDSLIEGTERDVAAILRFARGLPEVDTARLGVVSGSYSSESAAKAMRDTGFGRAHVALSPGSFSDESYRAAEASGAAWLFVRSDDERFVREGLDAKVRALTPSAELWVVRAGSAHATDLLAADSAMSGRLAAWLAARLTGPRIRYLANEGVMLEGSRGRVLMDALFGDGLPEYPTVPPASRDSLERALGPYGGTALVLVTHAHRDHFDSAAVARYRRNNPGAVVVGPPGIDSTPPSVDLGWVRVRPLAIPHGPTRRPVGHAAYLVTLDGTTALHLGDTSSDPATWRGAGVPKRGVDIAMVPYWYALDEARFEAARAVLRAKTVVLFHAALDSEESGGVRGMGGWAEVSRRLRERYPEVWAPLEPMVSR